MKFSDVDKDLVNLSSLAYKKCNLRDGNIEAYYCKYADGLSFSFRGTHKNGHSTSSLLKDILTDIRFRPTWTPDFGWHPVGFTHAAMRICDDIERMIIDKETPLYVDGHSLGAGVSAITAAFLCRRGYTLAAGRFFAIPHVGRLKSLRGKNVIGYRYGNDIVPLLPPFYRHDIPIVQFGKPIGPIKSHSLDNYIGEICG